MWKLATLALVLLVMIPVSVVIYYQFDPEVLTKLSFYINLANPSMRIVKINEGLRQEEVAEILFNKLDWPEESKVAFAKLALAGKQTEGRLFPKTYLIHKNEAPERIAEVMVKEFETESAKIVKPRSVLNEENVLKIASIIQREAAGRHDMALISGILWNRIWSEMKLQVDATLQYAKGSEENNWWPRVSGSDRKIKSLYNTYLHGGLPPTPIANPGKDALWAAYNPAKTSCLFYLHDKNRGIHCTKTYEEHQKNIELYLK